MSTRPAPTILACFALASLVATGVIAHAQTDDASTVLAEVRARYGALRGLRARFEQRFHHRLHERDDRWRGRIALQRPGRLRIDYDVPRGRVLASDGTRIVSYEPEPAPGQYYEQAASEDAMPIALGLLMGVELPEGAVIARLVDARQTGFAGSVIELRPSEPVAQYERVWLYVDRAEERRGRVHRVMIIDHAGNTNRFDLIDQVENPRLAESTFVFRPPASARRIEP
ncbi:LolA family protein [Sandaracinus amylolyticus]|uniref:LolA family protein n=1 Tax=Sandaracinus amylolyticus TaxID=927083 RepID=UPI00069EF39E|nr:outer membrane lipoprotein carrier protein LolA [Sandaracinus amylolyticus]